MKIVSTGRTISTTEYLEKKNRAHRKRLLVACGALLLIIIAAIFALRLKSMQIGEVAVSGAVVTGTAPVEVVIRGLLSGKYLWLVPKTNALLYPRTLIERKLLEKFPRFSTVAVSLEGVKRLTVSVVEREPFALYCQELAPSGVEGCYFLDDTGFIFDTAPSFSEGVYFTYSSSDILEDPLGKQFLPRDEFQAFASFVEKLQKLSLNPLSLNLTSSEARLILKTGGTILFPRTSDIVLVFSDLESFLGSPAITEQADFWQRLSVLDLRTENKVFYTFRD